MILVRGGRAALNGRDHDPILIWVHVKEDAPIPNASPEASACFVELPNITHQRSVVHPIYRRDDARPIRFPNPVKRLLRGPG